MSTQGLLPGTACVHVCARFNDHKWKQYVAEFKPLKIFNCNSCKRRCSSLASLKAHINHMHCDGKHKCEHCARYFSTRTVLRIHTEENHLGITFQCPQCNVSYSHKTSLRAHLKSLAHFKSLASFKKTETQEIC
uniref:C2H2-type domain-containing protein n=1 Tax=Cacopsylla melanoneura TaxID=428564 RepID=A0A8D9ASJ3_9HEMI